MVYDTFTFTSAVAWAGFVLTSLIWLVLIADAIVNRELNKMKAAMEVSRDWRKVSSFAVIWFVSGWYLFG